MAIYGDGKHNTEYTTIHVVTQFTQQSVTNTWLFIDEDEADKFFIARANYLFNVNFETVEEASEYINSSKFLDECFDETLYYSVSVLN